MSYQKTSLLNVTLATFAEVEIHYNNIKPVVSKYHHRVDDIRPIGRRDRKWERIEKRSDTEYVFHDYYFRGETFLTQSMSGWQKRPPIVWQKQEMPTGTRELVTIRGSVTNGFDTGRHNFLRAYMPKGLRWCVHTNGIHDVQIELDPHEISRGSNYCYMPRPDSDGSNTDYLLQFIRVNGGGSFPMWECITPEWPKRRVRVDKNRKKQLKQYNDEFWKWMCSVGPMLSTDWRTIENLKEEIREYMETSGKRHNRMAWTVSRVSYWFPINLAEEIVKDYNHPLRIHMACSFLQQNDIKSLEGKEDSNKFRSAYNRWFNKTLGLMKEVVE